MSEASLRDRRYRKGLATTSSDKSDNHLVSRDNHIQMLDLPQNSLLNLHSKAGRIYIKASAETWLVRRR